MEIFIVMVLVLAVMDACVRRRTYYKEHKLSDTWICPCCKTRYKVDYGRYDYCPNCGQAIDWRDSK